MLALRWVRGRMSRFSGFSRMRISSVSAKTSCTTQTRFLSTERGVAPRVRYAPSPTGSLHLGGLRTALYNYLLARSHPDGKFVLRIEDTDRRRLVPGAQEELQRALQWAGLQYDWGPDTAADDAQAAAAGPFVQSERLSLYQDAAQRLVDEGHAYHCFCSADRLASLREAQQRKGFPSIYDRFCLHMPEDEVQSRLADPECSSVVRLRVPDGETVVEDRIRGKISFANTALDDQVLLKTDGFPTYHLAVVVDDHHMGITHVIRGDEWLTSTPKHVVLYEALGWPKPEFVHLPLLLDTERRKLSKRHGDASVQSYMDRGVLPEALVNFVALLGWSPGDQDEVFSLEDLVKRFSLDRVQKNPATVNMDKLKWLNTQHVRRLDPADLARRAMPAFERLAESQGEAEYAVELGRVEQVAALLQARLSTVDQLAEFGRYFFWEPDYDGERARDLKEQVWSDAASPAHLEHLHTCLEAVEDWSADTLRPVLKETRKSMPRVEGKVSQKQMFLLLRLVLTGTNVGADLSTTMALLGREVALRRLLQNPFLSS